MTPTPRATKQGTTTGLTYQRKFATDGVHPYDEITWERRNIEQKNWKTGVVTFEQHGVEYPDFWGANAATIVTTKYFRGAVGTPQRETSLKHVIDRVVDTYVAAAKKYHYFATAADADNFGADLKWLLVHQYFSFNSPVWFNVGTDSPQRVAACFILSVDDSMDSILNWYREEGLIFKGGSGAGINLSRLRGSTELLANGGIASGPVSFMRGADASAGTIKSGGSTRRAAKMVVLDVDHPDIEEFVDTKAREEDKIRVLRDAGYDMDLGGKDLISVQYQNANNSVRVTDEFMRAVEGGTGFDLKARTTGETTKTVDAQALWHRIAEAAWACADPGMQYHDTINDWHTNTNTGPITASNPCSEYHSIDNSSCNLASLNLLKFLDGDDQFDTDRFVHAVEAVFTAMDVSICFATSPTEAITKNTRDFRQLGIGYANLGALLMAKGLAYDSVEGRSLAAAITSVMTGASYRRSAELAAIVGPYKGYKVNTEPHKRVMRKHRWAANALVSELNGEHVGFVADNIVAAHTEAVAIAERGLGEWDRGNALGDEHGWRNAQASVLAPTGTISFMMGCDTTGIEPDFALVKFKKLVGGSSLRIVNEQVPRALTALGYDEEAVDRIVAHISDTGSAVDAPGLDPDHYAVFDCAVGTPRSIAPMGHVRMMAAVQPFLSGAISKTVNLPKTATVEDVADVYMQSWKYGLKAVAIYRDECKVGQPLSDGNTKKDTGKPVVIKAEPEVRYIERPKRERLPKTRVARTTSFKVGQSEGYMTVGEYDDGRPGELFLKMSKQGSTLAGVMDALSVTVSLGLQYGVPIETYVAKFVNQRFEPAGMTDDKDIRMAQSIIDYVFRRLALNYLDPEIRQMYGIYTIAERTAALDAGDHGAPTVFEEPLAADEVAPEPGPAPAASETGTVTQHVMDTREAAVALDAPVCMTCGTARWMVRAGSCYSCGQCGSTTGCS